MIYFTGLKKNKMSLSAAGIQTLLYSRVESIPQSIPQVTIRSLTSCVLEWSNKTWNNPATSWTPLSMINDFDNDIIINTYDIIHTYGMILHMISEMISWPVLYWALQPPHPHWSLDGEGPFVSDLSVLLCWHCDYKRDPAECVSSVRRHWLHPHPVVASLQPLQLPALSWLFGTSCH